MALFGLFKKKGSSATDTIDLTRMRGVRDKLAASATSAATPAAPATGDSGSAGMASMDLPMGTFDSNVSQASTPYSYSQTSDDKLISLQGKFNALYQRVDLLEHKVDRLERKTGIKSESEI